MYIRLTEEEKKLARQSHLLNPLVEGGCPPAVLPERWSAGHASSSADEGISSPPSAVPPDVPSIGEKGGKDPKGNPPKMEKKYHHILPPLPSLIISPFSS